MSNSLRKWLALFMSMLMLMSALPAFAATSPTGGQGKCCPKCGSYNFEYGYEERWKDPTCTEPGRAETEHCFDCGYFKWKDIPALGHDWSDDTWQIKDSTCTEHGQAGHICMRCKLQATFSLKPLGHKWGEWYVVEEPTPVKNGYEEHKCKRCGITEQRELVWEGGDYNISTALYLDSAPTAFYGKAGDTIDLYYHMTNAGDVELAYFGSYWKMENTHGQNMVGNVSALFYARDRFVPEDSIDLYIKYTVLEQDIADGEIVFTFQANANVYLDGNTDVPMDPVEGRNSVNAYMLPVVTNEITVAIPILDASEIDYDFLNALQLTPTGQDECFYGTVGDYAEFDFNIENVGESYLCVTHCEITDVNGKLLHYVKNINDMHDGEWVYMKPENSYNFTLPIDVTEDDFAAGEIVRRITYFGDLWVDENGIPAHVAGSTFPQHHDIYQDVVTSNTVTVVLPIGEGDEPTPDWFEKVLFEKSVHSPYNDGAAAGLGDEIVFTLSVINNSDMTMFDIEITDDLNGSNEDANITMGDVLEPGKSKDYSVRYTVRPQDVAGGYVENTANLRWSFAEDETSGELNSNTVVVPTYNGRLKGGDLVVTKELLNEPANGEYFVEGETVVFKVTMRNESDDSVYDVELTDALWALIGTTETSLCSIDVMESGVERVFTYVYTVENWDARLGYIENTAYAKCYTPDDEPFCAMSEKVYVPTSAAGVLPPEENEGDAEAEGPSVVLTKTVTSTPANGEYYVLGETITYEITAKNNGTVGVGDVKVCDTPVDHKTGVCTSVIELGKLNQLYVGEERVFEYSHMVNATDVHDGAVENVAVIYYSFDGKKYDPISNYVESPTGIDENALVPAVWMSFTKDVVNAPANGQYYVPGETVEYAISLHNFTCDMTDVIIEDSLADNPIAYLPVSEFGDIQHIPFSYTVTEWDAWTGSLINAATLTGVSENGETITLSCDVSVPTGFGAFGVITEMTITKSEYGAPTNGSYYVEGEKILYEIVIRNDGETDFGECVIYDSLANREISNTGHLYVNEERRLKFEYTVTAADVAAGYVCNTAWVEYDTGAVILTKMSNMVVCDTDGFDDDFVPGTGVIMPPSLRMGGDEFVPCSYELTKKGDNGEEHITHYCTTHAFVQLAMADLLDAAETDADKLDAWKQAEDMWRAEIDAMYEIMLNAADAMARINIMNERIHFYASVGCHEALLNKIYPDNPTLVAEKIAKMLMNKSVDMCYEMNTAPNDRVDAFEHVSTFDNDILCSEKCAKAETALNNGEIAVTDTFCEHHATVNQMRSFLMSADGSKEQAWKTVGQLWKIEVNTAYNGLFATADETLQSILLADYKAFENSIAARENVLYALYGSDEVVNEAAAMSMAGRAAEMCGLK